MSPSNSGSPSFLPTSLPSTALSSSPSFTPIQTITIVEDGSQTTDLRLRDSTLASETDSDGTYLAVLGRESATNEDNWIVNIPIQADDDFVILAKLKVDGSGSAASFFINDLDIFGFDGGASGSVNKVFTESNSAFHTGFVEADYGTYNDNLFHFKVERMNGTIKFYIDGQEVASTASYNVSISKFMWRPWRANLKIYDWSIWSPSIESFNMPSPNPSISMQPSVLPSLAPSSSSQPSLLPSTMPSSSIDPSALPSLSPSSSSQPSLAQSQQPSMSPFYICLYEEKKHQDESQLFAEGNGGNLVSIHCEEQNNQVYNTFGVSNKIWIGVNDKDNEGDFVNNDESDFDYDNWEEDEPDNNGNTLFGGEDCVIMGDNWGNKWIDTGCANLNDWYGVVLVPDPINGLTCVEYVGK